MTPNYIESSPMVGISCATNYDFFIINGKTKDSFSEEFPIMISFLYKNKNYCKYISMEQYEIILTMRSPHPCICMDKNGKILPYDLESLEKYKEEINEYNTNIWYRFWKNYRIKHRTETRYRNVFSVNGKQKRYIVNIIAIILCICINVAINGGWIIWIFYVLFKLFLIFKDWLEG